MNTDTIRALLADHQLYHSDFQMDFLITSRAGGTPYGCYKQALREVYKRWRGLKGLYSERALLDVDVDELASKLASGVGDAFEQRRNEIHLVRKRLDREELNRNIHDSEREFSRFAAQAAALKDKVGELTPERRADLDRDMWRHRVRCMAAVDLITTSRLGVNTITFLQAAPLAWRAPILKEIRDTLRHEDPEKDGPLVEWFESYETPAALGRGPGEIPALDVKALLEDGPEERTAP